MTNENIINIIRKYFEGTEDLDTVVLFDGMRVTEIDEDCREIYYDGEVIGFKDIDINYIKVFEVNELYIEDDLGSFIKDVKKSKKTLDNYINSKKLLVFKDNEDYILNSERVDELMSLEYLIEHYENLTLYEFNLIKNPKV